MCERDQSRENKFRSSKINSKLSYLFKLWINNFFNDRYIGDVAPDFPTLLRQSSPTIPIILLSDNELDTAVRLFTDFANRKQNRHTEIFLTDNSIILERVVRKQIQKGMAEVRLPQLVSFQSQILSSACLLLSYFQPRDILSDQRKGRKINF